MKTRVGIGLIALLLIVAAIGHARFHGVRFARACDGVELRISTNQLTSLFQGGPAASYSIGQSGFEAMVYTMPRLSGSRRTDHHGITNAESFPLCHGAMVVIIDSGSKVAAYQRINESSLEIAPEIIGIPSARDVRTIRELVDVMLWQNSKSTDAGVPYKR
jgi:hypothetical protein